MKRNKDFILLIKSGLHSVNNEMVFEMQWPMRTCIKYGNYYDKFRLTPD